MSTLLMAVITTNLLLILLSLLLCNKYLMVGAGSKILALFPFFVLLRFILPIEFPFTRNIYLPVSVSQIVAMLHNPLFVLGGHSVSLWMMFQWVWGIGFLCGMIKYIWDYRKARQYITLYGKVITDKEPYHKLLAQICQEQKRRKNPFVVLEIPGIKVPMLFGIFVPYILVPENFSLSERDTYFILRHEASHHFHHDLLLKSLIRVITLIYWWDPFCILLNRQTSIILEMRVDSSLTLTDIDATIAYMNCLLEVSQYSECQTPLTKDFTMPLLRVKQSDLKKRYFMLCNNQEKHKRAMVVLLCLALISIYVLSYTFILEIYCNPNIDISVSSQTPTNDTEIFKMTDGVDYYCIDNGDGTYDIYYDNCYLLTESSLEGYPKDMVIYSKEDCP